MGGDRGPLKAVAGDQRGDLDDHAQLDRDLDRRVAVQPRRPAAEQQSGAGDVPVSNDIVEGAKLPVFWGDPQLQGLHIGMFIALAALLVFWVLLNRTTTGYEVRAVGFSPDAARASGISVRRNYILVMAVCGAFAGLGGHARPARLAVPGRHQRHPAQPGRRSSGSRSRCSGATRRSASLLPRCCSAR